MASIRSSGNGLMGFTGRSLRYGLKRSWRYPQRTSTRKVNMAKLAEQVLRGVSDAARAVGCAEQTMRSLERRGVIRPLRDSAGRRLFSESDVAAARSYIEKKRRTFA
jgi:hypothetical protein